MIVPQFLGKLTSDFLRIFNMGVFEKWHQRLGGRGADVNIVITKFELQIEPNAPISKKQIRYYYGVIIKLFMEATGYGKIESDNQLKSRYKIQSKSLLTAAQAEAYFAKCRRFMSEELSLYVPLPNEVVNDLLDDCEDYYG